MLNLDRRAAAATGIALLALAAVPAAAQDLQDDHLRPAEPVGHQLLPDLRRDRRGLLRRRGPRTSPSNRSTARRPGAAGAVRGPGPVRPPGPGAGAQRPRPRRRRRLHLQSDAEALELRHRGQGGGDLPDAGRPQGPGDRHRHRRRRRGRRSPATCSSALGMTESTRTTTFLTVGDGGPATAAFTRGDIAAYSASTADAAILNQRGLAVRDITPAEFTTLLRQRLRHHAARSSTRTPSWSRSFGRAFVRGARPSPSTTPTARRCSRIWRPAMPQESEDPAFASALFDAVRSKTIPRDASQGPRLPGPGRLGALAREPGRDRRRLEQPLRRSRAPPTPTTSCRPGTKACQ